MWIKAEDLECDYHCGTRFMDRGSRHQTVESARAMGWHCYHGPSQTGKPLIVHICPSCIGLKAPKSEGGEDVEQLGLL
jgi:hypothetical protein